MTGEDKDEFLTFTEKIKHFFKTKETKEVLLIHLAIMTLGSIIYLVSSPLVTAIFLAVTLSLEMFVFHVLWIYRENKEKESPIKYAVVKELKIVVTVLASIGLFVFINNFIYDVTGVSIFIPFAILFFLLFFGSTIYKVHRARVTEDDVEELGLD